MIVAKRANTSRHCNLQTVNRRINKYRELFKWYYTTQTYVWILINCSSSITKTCTTATGYCMTIHVSVTGTEVNSFTATEIYLFTCRLHYEHQSCDRTPSQSLKTHLFSTAQLNWDVSMQFWCRIQNALTDWLTYLPNHNCLPMQQFSI